MKCPKCGSDDIRVQIVQEQKVKEKKKGLLYWITIGWFWEPIMWIFLTLPKLIVTIFKPKKYKVKTKPKKMAICQSCGKTWKV